MAKKKRYIHLFVAVDDDVPDKYWAAFSDSNDERGGTHYYQEPFDTPSEAAFAVAALAEAQGWFSLPNTRIGFTLDTAYPALLAARRAFKKQGV